MVSDPVIPDAVWAALNAAHSAAGSAPARTGAIVNGGPMASTRHGSALGFQNISPMHSMALTHKPIKDSGSEASRLTASAHLANRGLPRQDRIKQA